MPSTLLFKFNNFHDISGSEGRLNPDEYSDIATKKGEWKVSVKPPGKLGLMFSTNNARDHCGNLWGIRMSVDYFMLITKKDGLTRNPNVDDYQYKLYITKVEPGKSVDARSFGYSIKSHFTLIARDVDGEAIEERECCMTNNLGSFECKNFIDGPSARSILQDNALIIEMVVEDDIVDFGSFNLPESSLSKNALDLLDSGEGADISFEVNGSIIPAHKFMLLLNARQLHSFFTKDNSSTVEIKGVTPELLRFMLRYIYGDVEPDFDYLVEHYQEVIDITDKYNIIGLKLEAQAAKIASLSIDADNVTEVLLYAHEKNCFLLKEYATKIYVSNYGRLVLTDSFMELARTPELLRELMIAVNGPSARKKKMTVNKLIGQLLDRDLDIDGPRDVLISRLEEYENRHDDDEEDEEEDEESE